MIFMASTQISPEKTAGEIMALLSKSGLVKYIQTEYENGEIIGISFIVVSGCQEVPFRLPVKWESVLVAMKKRNSKTPNHLCFPDQARRVAWRQVLRWVQAQLALIEVGMVDIKEVFMPYLMVSQEKTLYQTIQGQGFKMIGPSILECDREKWEENNQVKNEGRREYGIRNTKKAKN